MKPKFPAVRFSERFISIEYRKIRRSLEYYLKKNGFNNTILIDSEGNRFLIRDTTILGQAFAPFHNPFNEEKYMRIELEYEFLRKMEKDEIVEEIIDLFERNPGWWAKYKRLELYEELRNSKTIRKVVNRGFAFGKNP